MKAKLGIFTCSYCQKEFDRVRQYQHLCGPECHVRWHSQERRRALAAYREMQRQGISIFLPTSIDSETGIKTEADDSKPFLRRA
jgi:hypothetical protein